jgi:hypothetical protein
LTVNYGIGGTATNGTDYTTAASLSIPSGSSTAKVTITPIADTKNESTETVILTLSPNAAYQIGSPGNATVNIANGEGGD